MILRCLIISLTILVAACEPRGLYETADGEAYLKNIVEIGSSFAAVSAAIIETEITFFMIDASECGSAGHLWYDPKYICAGGSALRLTLSENARPYNPFYSPSMNAFLAFDDSESLHSVIVTLEGGD